MDEKTFEIYEGINLHIINTDRFKSDFIAAFVFTDLSKENVTKNALIPAVLRRGCEGYPTMKDISIFLEENYGSVFDASSDKIGDKQVLQFYITSLNNNYTFDGEDLLSKNTEMLCNIMLKPKLNNDSFDELYVKQEKETLRELIRSKINNKGSYANIRCIEEMCKNEPYGLYKFGYEEDLENITATELYKQYKKILSTSEIHFYISGNVDSERIENILKAHFKNLDRKFDASKVYDNFEIKECEEKIVKEHQEVTQGKLVLGFRIKDHNVLENMYKFMLYSAILGGTPSSKLFQNVREKESLAYTIRSIYMKHKGIVLVSAGIEISNYEKALRLIKKEIEDIRVGNFTEEDIANAKSTLENAYLSYLDDQVAVINIYMGQRLLGNTQSIDEMINNMKSVTKADIMEMANKLELKMTYFLTDEE